MAAFALIVDKKGLKVQPPEAGEKRAFLPLAGSSQAECPRGEGKPTYQEVAVDLFAAARIRYDVSEDMPPGVQVSV